MVFRKVYKMKNKNIHSITLRTITILAVSFFTLVFTLSAGCSLIISKPSDNQFKIMEVKNNIARFSFKYRTYYHEADAPYIIDDKYFRFTALTIAASPKTISEPNPEPGKASETADMSYAPASIRVLVSNAINQPFRPAQDRISNHLTSWSRWSKFKLLERKDILISGIQGEMAAYEVDGLIGPKLLYQSDVAFDYDDQEWNLHLEADVALTDIVKEDLQLVIDTFKILE
jgi:hypothetical protein